MKVGKEFFLLSVSFWMAGCVKPARDVLFENKAVVMRAEKEVWSGGHLEVVEQLYAREFVCHFVVGPEWHGLDGLKAAVKKHRMSFPDWNEKVEDIVAEGDRVVVRSTSTGTHRGEFEGIAATGRKVNIQEVTIYRVVKGKIVEQWGLPDLNGLMSQLREVK